MSSEGRTVTTPVDQERGRTHTTLTGPRRCVYCGHRCHGRTCRWHAGLAMIEAAMRGDFNRWRRRRDARGRFTRP